MVSLGHPGRAVVYQRTRVTEATEAIDEVGECARRTDDAVCGH